MCGWADGGVGGWGGVNSSLYDMYDRTNRLNRLRNKAILTIFNDVVEHIWGSDKMPHFLEKDAAEEP